MPVTDILANHFQNIQHHLAQPGDNPAPNPNPEAVQQISNALTLLNQELQQHLLLPDDAYINDNPTIGDGGWLWRIEHIPPEYVHGNYTLGYLVRVYRAVKEDGLRYRDMHGDVHQNYSDCLSRIATSIERFLMHLCRKHQLRQNNRIPQEVPLLPQITHSADCMNLLRTTHDALINVLHVVGDMDLFDACARPRLRQPDVLQNYQSPFTPGDIIALADYMALIINEVFLYKDKAKLPGRVRGPGGLSVSCSWLVVAWAQLAHRCNVDYNELKRRIVQICKTKEAKRWREALLATADLTRFVSPF